MLRQCSAPTCRTLARVAMTKFYLNIQNGIGLVIDEEGRELDSLEAARAEAVGGIRAIISEEAKTGLLDLTGRIEVMDAEGHLLSVVGYADAMELRLSEKRPS